MLQSSYDDESSFQKIIADFWTIGNLYDVILDER